MTGPATVGRNEGALLADIGGSNARFAWLMPQGHLCHVRTLAVAAYPGVVEAVRSYLATLPAELGGAGAAPRCAALAVACAVEGDKVELTNSSWCFSQRALCEALGLQRLRVLNDFEALALSLPRLQGHQLRSHAAELPRPQGTLAVIGPGTGLGVAGVVQTAQGWQALPGEGGHATLAPADAFESELLAHVRRDLSHVSAERLLSGMGLPRLHRAVAAVHGQVAAELGAEALVEAALAGSDVLCVRTLESFCALLGGFAGNVALTLGARGGVYIGGGIVPRLGDFFFRSQFRQRFEAKGRFESYLQAIPTALITDTLAALGGAAVALEPSAAHKPA
ncbi:glucokinase [Roseateles sp. BYS180W]|uniref:Glucokinase n=1 Tax=Roseateles rivi TaxID=3299028 RepID=A0ABW7FS13_9BURK